MTNVELYTSPSCLHCREAKKLADDLCKDNPTINLRLIDVSQEEGARAAFENKVLTLPTFLVHDENGELRVSGSDRKKLMDYFNRQTYTPQGDGPRFLKIGAGLGLYSALYPLIIGAVCPSCIVLAAASFIYGFYKVYSDRLKTNIFSQSPKVA